MPNRNESHVDPLRPRLRDSPEAIGRRARPFSVALLVLAALGLSLCHLNTAGWIGEGVHALAITGLATAAAPFAIVLMLLVLRAIRIKAGGLALTERDLDQVVAYAHRLGISQQARERAANDPPSSLAYPSIEAFMDWLEQQSMMRRAGGG